jgi:hypothetical protein
MNGFFGQQAGSKRLKTASLKHPESSRETFGTAHE